MTLFDPSDHSYRDGSGKSIISVTQLLKKHRLAPDYGDVPEEILKAKAEYGSAVHKEIENFAKTGEEGLSKEFQSFLAWAKSNNVEILGCEEIVSNDIVAGTYDMLANVDGTLARIDWKTSYSLDEDYVGWQLSCYDRMDCAKASKLLCGHFLKDGSLEFIELPKHPDEEIDRLFQAERDGDPFIPDLSYRIEEMKKSDTVIELEKVEALILGIEKSAEEAREREKKLKESLLKAMESNGVGSFETDSMKVTYVGPFAKKAIDSERLKKEKPDVYSEYLKEIQTNPSVRITAKKPKEKENA